MELSKQLTVVPNLFLQRGTFTAQRTPVFFRCAVLGAGHAHAVSTVQSPLPIDFGKLVVECEQTLFEVIDISSENLVERNLIPFIYRYHGAMHVWVEFVKVYIEAYDIILPPICHTQTCTRPAPKVLYPCCAGYVSYQLHA